MDQLLEQFLGEARENLAFIDQNIEDIGGADPELLNSVFRAAHTLKGGSGIVGFDSVRDITHCAEDLLDMLRDGRLELADGMIEALYDAFDEVLNLVEAAEESCEIIDADEEKVNSIVTNLNTLMGKNPQDEEVQWSSPFILIDDKSSIVDLSLKALSGVKHKKVNFNLDEINQDFCDSENFYGIILDIDESCMVYGNDPLYALSLLGDSVLGVYACMSVENSKAVLSGTEDEEGLLLKTYLVAFVYGVYDEIEEELFNFSDEMEVLPLDIETLLQVDSGDGAHQIDSLKELSGITDTLDLNSISDKVAKSLELVGQDSLQHAQLQRFLDIYGLIKDEDTAKLNMFFKNIYKGEVYFPKNVAVDDALEITKEAQTDENKPEEISIVKEDEIKQADEITQTILNGMLEQQYNALEFVESDDDVARVSEILYKMKQYIPEIPSKFNSKDELMEFLSKKLSKDEIKIDTEQNQEVEVKAEVKKEKNVEVKKETKKAVIGKTVKIEQESIDSLMNVVGELLVAKNSLPYLADNVVSMTHDMIKREIMEKYIFINRLSEQLQDLIMGMRMLPISYVFDRYPKLVRDISKKMGKKVKLDMSGGDTKLDKNMIEMLADPLIHIMRNSLDHGIEMPDIREKKGKEASGIITLKAYAQSDKIIIKIIDDGAGINVEKVAAKVLEKGLMTPEEIDALNESEMAELVLLPGLSTAEVVTEFSGRGVGMDVVKKSIDVFGGSINISTKANVGTTITLSIPMSLAVSSLLHIQMNEIHYGIPMDSVSETVKIEKSKIEYLHNEPFIYIRGEVIPLLFIKSMLNEDDIDTKPLSIVVLNIKDNLLAVVVNQFLGQLDVVQKPLVGIMQNHPLFSGTALLGNGQIIMSIDPLGLLKISQHLKKDEAVA
ncbi:MAG: chemotaxis protein CheA [Sulfurimonas sp.]|nr:chemotaxis protein CheA [Sulfurimonas sp.]